MGTAKYCPHAFIMNVTNAKKAISYLQSIVGQNLTENNIEYVKKILFPHQYEFISEPLSFYELKEHKAIKYLQSIVGQIFTEKNIEYFAQILNVHP